MSYLSQHKARVLKQVNLNLSTVTKGTIAFINYTSVLGETSLRLCLVVSPRFNDEMHVIDLDDVPVKRLHELIQFTEDKEPGTRGKPGQEYSYVPFDKVGKQLYENVLRKFITQRVPNSYKTLKRDGVKRIVGVLYKWDESMLPPKPKKFNEPQKPIK